MLPTHKRVVSGRWTTVYKISSRTSRKIKVLTACLSQGCDLQSHVRQYAAGILCGDQPSVSIHWLSGCSPLVHCPLEDRALVSYHNWYMINYSRADRCPVPAVREESWLCGSTSTLSLHLSQLHQQ